MATARRMVAFVCPDHQAMSETFAGPRPRRCLTTSRRSNSSVSASSAPSSAAGTHASNAVKVSAVPTGGPCTRTRSSHRKRSMWEPRLDDESIPTVAHSSRMPSLVNATAAPRGPTKGIAFSATCSGSRSGSVVASTKAAPARSTSSSVSPRAARRFSTPERARWEHRPVSHATSSAAMMWCVPRMGHVRISAPDSSAACTSEYFAPFVRMPTAHRAAFAFCACMASMWRTADTGSAARSLAVSSCARHRAARAAVGVSSSIRVASAPPTAAPPAPRHARRAPR